MNQNAVKAALRAGRPQVGTWLSLGNVYATRLMARVGFPWLTLDIEHSPIDWSDAALVFGAIADAGCVLGNQMVLLKGVNDRAETVFALNRWLLRHRCRPYYILHCDSAPGVAHFRTHTDVGLASCGL